MHPSLQCSFKLASTSCNTLVFSGNAAKVFVFDDLALPELLCFLFTEPGLCMTQNGQLADCEQILSESDKKCIGLES